MKTRLIIIIIKNNYKIYKTLIQKYSDSTKATIASTMVDP